MKHRSLPPPNMFWRCAVLCVLCIAIFTSSIPVNAGVSDNLDSFAVRLAEWVGINNEIEDPEVYEGSLITKMNYMNKRLDASLSAASSGKLRLQSSLSSIGNRIGVSSPFSDEPASFEEIDNYTNAIALQYDTKLGQLSDDLVAANANKTMIVSTSGWSGIYDGKNHAITVTVDTDLYDVKYGESADSCDLDTSPVYSSVGDHKVYYSIVGKNNTRAMTGSEIVSIEGLAGALTLSSTSASLAKGTSTTVTATNRSGGNVTATSSNTGVATVTKNGNTFTVNGVSAGTCTISFVGAAAGNYKGATASMSVTVLNGYTLSYKLEPGTAYSSHEIYVHSLSSYGCSHYSYGITKITYIDVFGCTQTLSDGTGTVTVMPNTTVNYEISANIQHVVDHGCMYDQIYNNGECTWVQLTQSMVKYGSEAYEYYYVETGSKTFDSGTLLMDGHHSISLKCVPENTQYVAQYTSSTYVN